MKRSILSIFVLFIFSYSFSQWVPFYSSNYNSTCRSIEFDSEFIYSMITIEEYPNFGGINNITLNDVGGSFTRIRKYNNNGLLVGELLLDDNHSLNYYGMFLKILPNNKLLVVGENYNFESAYESHGIFFSIIDKSLNSIDFTYNFPFTNFDEFPDNVILTDSTFLIKNYSKLFEFDFEGSFLNTLNLTNSCAPFSSTITNNALFYINSSTYFLTTNSLGSGLILNKLEANNTCTNVFTEDINTILHGNQIGLSTFPHFGKDFNETSYLINGLYGPSKFPCVFSFSDEVELLFIDTTDNLIYDFGFSKLDYLNPNQIYFTYSKFDPQQDGVFIYSINQHGTLNWKKYFPLDAELEKKYNFPLFASKAINDGFIVTYSVKNYFNKSDVYILRVDSNGNAKNFVTSVNNLHDSAFNFNIYPNPAQNTLNIVAETETNFSVEIYNTIGQRFTNSNNIYYNEAKINIENLAKGIYFYQINNSKGELLKFGKFLKE